MNIRPTDRTLGASFRIALIRLVHDELDTIDVSNVAADGSVTVSANTKETLDRIRTLLQDQMRSGALEHLGNPYRPSNIKREGYDLYNRKPPR